MGKYFKTVETELEEQYQELSSSQEETALVIRKNNDNKTEDYTIDNVIRSVGQYLSAYSQDDANQIILSITKYWKLMEEIEILEKDMLLFKVLM
jgi:hypothetical protein